MNATDQGAPVRVAITFPMHDEKEPAPAPHIYITPAIARQIVALALPPAAAPAPDGQPALYGGRIASLRLPLRETMAPGDVDLLRRRLLDAFDSYYATPQPQKESM